MLSPSSAYHKLHTNERLTSGEEVEVRRAMSESLNKRKAVESETARLQDRLIFLGQRRQDTEKFIEVHQGLLSPIRRLLPEILQEIFWRCLPMAHNSVLSLGEAPLILGRICSQWRRIAYSTPKLWSSLHIVASPLTYPRAKARFEASSAWLARSGSLPLSISMSDIGKNSMSADQFQPYLDLIAKYVRRWKYIHLHYPFCDSIDFLLEIDANDSPLLELFHIDQGAICFREHDTLDRSLSRKNSILFAPLLHVLSVHNTSFRLLDLPLQWSQLTGVDLLYLPLPEFFKLLRLCSNLETCAANLGYRDNPLVSLTNSQSSDSRPKIVLSKLRTLKICGKLNQNHDSLILLNNLSAPALRHFAYQHLVGPNSSFPSTELFMSLKVFRSFFQRLNDPLQELDFITDDLTIEYLMEFLSLFPELKRLSLRCSFGLSFNDRLLSGFIPYEHRSHCHLCSLEEGQVEEHDLNSPSFTCLCPNLEVLNVDNALFSKHILLEYLRSRLVDYDKYNVARLRRFSISFNLKLEGYDMTEEIDRLAEESGLLDMHLRQRLDKRPLRIHTDTSCILPVTDNRFRWM